MMGTLAAALARKGIETPEDVYRAEVEGDIENVNGVLRITQIRVDYHLTAGDDKTKDAKEAFASYLLSCPAAQSVIGCIDIRDNLVLHAKE
jgi:organic hydroperoxide reductase OsmC/OhrA